MSYIQFFLDINDKWLVSYLKKSWNQKGCLKNLICLPMLYIGEVAAAQLSIEVILTLSSHILRKIFNCHSSSSIFQLFLITGAVGMVSGTRNKAAVSSARINTLIDSINLIKVLFKMHCCQCWLNCVLFYWPQLKINGVWTNKHMHQHKHESYPFSIKHQKYSGGSRGAQQAHDPQKCDQLCCFFHPILYQNG